MGTYHGLRILYVEDEGLIAMLVEDMLRDLGFDVVLAMRLDAGLRLAREADIHAALLDLNLGQGFSYPIADMLLGRGIPFLFATGYGHGGVETAYRTCPVLQKPFDIDALAEALSQLTLQPESTGT